MAPAAGFATGGAFAMSRPSPGEFDLIERSIEVVAHYFSIPVDQLVAPIRRRSVILPRQKAMYLAYELSGATLVEVGRHFGRDDEASVWYPLLRVYLLATTDRVQAAEVRGLARIIEAERASQVDWDARPRVRRR